ncbi:mannose-1-phosphate guanylyltransferase [Patescibacteria group bacterium]|nr:mannose-1-phosphate guanylyltransferase [Patescibacteria group bacterium]
MSKSDYKDHLFALIVVGGGGTRLWPRSRNATPKQFLKLFNRRSLTQITSYRLHKILPWEKIVAVTTTQPYKKEILKQVPEFVPENILVEPFRRNTAPAHGLGAAYIFSKDNDAVIINDYADHLMSPEKSYFNTMRSAAEATYSGDWLLATGIKPTYPNVGYGYIQRGNKWKTFEGKTIYKLKRFTEKPKLEVAKKYLAFGEYYWNAGQFVWRADSLLKALKKHEPKVGHGLEIISKAIGTKDEKKVIKAEYEKMPDISIDYAVAERATNFLFIIADYNWTDIGDWKEVWENLPKDHLGNVVIDGDEPGGEIINLGTSDALIHTDGRLIVVIDVDNIVVVDTKNAVLICSKSKAQNVKKIVQQLKKEKKVEYL